MGRMEMHTGFWLEIHKERDHQADLDVYGRIILRQILETLDVIWIGLIWLRMW
jgi:hypothetical protein